MSLISRHIIQIPSPPVFALIKCCMLCGEATNTNFSVLVSVYGGYLKVNVSFTVHKSVNHYMLLNLTCLTVLLMNCFLSDKSKLGYLS